MIEVRRTPAVRRLILPTDLGMKPLHENALILASGHLDGGIGDSLVRYATIAVRPVQPARDGYDHDAAVRSHFDRRY